MKSSGIVINGFNASRARLDTEAACVDITGQAVHTVGVVGEPVAVLLLETKSVACLPVGHTGVASNVGADTPAIAEALKVSTSLVSRKAT